MHLVVCKSSRDVGRRGKQISQVTVRICDNRSKHDQTDSMNDNIRQTASHLPIVDGANHAMEPNNMNLDDLNPPELMVYDVIDPSRDFMVTVFIPDGFDNVLVMKGPAAIIDDTMKIMMLYIRCVGAAMVERGRFDFRFPAQGIGGGYCWAQLQL
ncbi:hypothetical protein N657DRAFT_638047 [Parathielavia appendiculata]|uniref:Uncharacterized protein n=1 Tax=Parathielavia appendiculata TaxID=2587402 RepID=A0AAN6YYM3_9PEZI|nr:hypothetical protein N657DRAFT_638047 [Parathielavia appendiculata]